MARSAPSIQDTVDQILKEVDVGPTIKAAATSGVKIPGGYQGYDPTRITKMRKQFGDAPVDRQINAPAMAQKQAWHQLADALRADGGPSLNYDVLHVVKSAMISGELTGLPPVEPVAETGDPVSSGFRKLANALRSEDRDAHEQLLAKGAHAIRAGRGLMLLRELVRE
jgi:hypothetical protein